MKCYTLEEFREMPVDACGWIHVPDGRRLKIGARAHMGDGASLGDYARLGAYARLGDYEVWETSPLQIQGSRRLLHACGVDHDHLRIGCEVHPIAHWLKNYESICMKNYYTTEQIEEYGRHIRLAAEMYTPELLAEHGA